MTQQPFSTQRYASGDFEPIILDDYGTQFATAVNELCKRFGDTKEFAYAFAKLVFRLFQCLDPELQCHVGAESLQFEEAAFRINSIDTGCSGYSPVPAAYLFLPRGLMRVVINGGAFVAEVGWTPNYLECWACHRDGRYWINEGDRFVMVQN